MRRIQISVRLDNAARSAHSGSNFKYARVANPTMTEIHGARAAIASKVSGTFLQSANASLNAHSWLMLLRRRPKSSGIALPP